MKKIYQNRTLILILFVLGAIHIQAQHLSPISAIEDSGHDEFLLGNPVAVIKPKRPAPCDCKHLGNLDFTYSRSLNIALANERLIELAAARNARNWYNKQTGIIKKIIEDRLGKKFSNYDQARKAFFEKTEINNRNKNTSRLAEDINKSRYRIDVENKKTLTSLKALILRKKDIEKGRPTSSFYADIKVNNTPLKNFNSISKINQELNKFIPKIKENSWKDVELDLIGTKIYENSFKGLLLNEAAVDKNKFYGNLGYWDRLSMMQFLLHYEWFKQHSRPPYLLTSQAARIFNDFNSKIDIATKKFIENSARKKIGKNTSVFHDDFWEQINVFEHGYPAPINQNGDENKRVAFAQAVHKKLQQQELDRLRNSASLGVNTSVDYLVDVVGLGSKDQYNWLNANGDKAITFQAIIKKALEQHGSLKISNGRNGEMISSIPEVHSVVRAIVDGGQTVKTVRELDRVLTFDPIIEKFLIRNSEVATQLKNSLTNNNTSKNKQLIKELEKIILKDCYLRPITLGFPGIRLFNYYQLEKDSLKEKHPDWTEERIVKEALLNMLHLGLDVVGLIPGVGEIADLTNGVIYLIRGDATNATLSFAATVPFAGWLATGAKLGIKAVAVKGSTIVSMALPFIKRADGFIHFGSRGALKKVISTLANEEAHHILPWAKRFNKVIQKAAEAGFHMNGAINGVALQKFKKLVGEGLHGNHPKYDIYVQRKLDKYLRDFPNATPEQAKQFLENNLIPELLDLIEQAKNSGLNLNNFFRTLI